MWAMGELAGHREQGIDERWAGQREEGQEMFPGTKIRKGKTTQTTQFLMLSSGVPNLGVSLVPGTQCEITGCFITSESCVASTNPAHTPPLSVPGL